MKLFIPLSVLVLLGIFTPNLWANPVITLTNGVGAGAFVETPIAGGDEWLYVDNSTTVGLGVPPTVQADTDALNVTFTDIAGVSLLNVTDICANVGVFTPANPCAGFAFSDTGLGAPYLINGTGDLAGLDLAAAANLNAGVLGIELGGASIGSGTAQIGFGEPPSVTPEPPALTLLGTGLLGIAGLMKKRLFA
ncbi:MAG: hypothetical protein WB439_18135 [Acidobacteriaceae bacterium]